VSARVEVVSESGVVVVGDARAALPSGLDQEILLQQLEPLARSGQIFFLVTDDPVRYRIDVMANETLPPGLDREFEPLGGAFRLAAICVLAARWRWLWYLVPLLAVSWLPYLVLKFGRRYRRAERRVSDAELARPHYVISLVPTQQEELHGGYVRV